MNPDKNKPEAPETKPEQVPITEPMPKDPEAPKIDPGEKEKSKKKIPTIHPGNDPEKGM